jgi:hypothetical protein
LAFGAALALAAVLAFGAALVLAATLALAVALAAAFFAVFFFAALFFPLVVDLTKLFFPIKNLFEIVFVFSHKM